MAVNWGQIAQVGLGMASNYAAGRQQAKQQAAQFAQNQNTQAIQQSGQQNQVLLQMAQLELLRKQMEEENRGNRARQVAQGDALASVQDARIDAPSHITRFNVSGGLRPSALGPNARTAGATLSSQAMGAQAAGDQFMRLNPAGPVDLNANMPGGDSAFDKIMALAGTVGNAYQGYQQQQRINQLTQPGTPGAVQGGTNLTYDQMLRLLMQGSNG